MKDKPFYEEEGIFFIFRSINLYGIAGIVFLFEKLNKAVSLFYLQGKVIKAFIRNKC